MGGIGMLDEVRPEEHALSAEAVVRPGGLPGSSLATSKTRATSEDEAVIAAIDAATADAIDRAEKRMERLRTSTTLSALAQAYGRGEAAVRVAREALDLAVGGRETTSGSAAETAGPAVDATSARIAANVLVCNDDAEYAYERLSLAATTPWLKLAFATVAAAMDRTDEAAQALQGVELQQAHAFRGYLAARAYKWAEAVHHLRLALKENPQDVDSLLNLSISLWRMGSVRKATRTALHATRLAPARKDVSLHYLELLLRQDQFEKVASELRGLHERGVIENASLTVTQARVALAQGDDRRGMSLLGRAAEQAQAEGDAKTRTEILSNLALMKLENGQVSREDAIRTLRDLVKDNPYSEVAILKYAQASARCSEAGPIREALERMTDLDPVHVAYLRSHLAILEGDAHSAASSSEEWLRLEPENAGAAAAVIVSIGIGEERWTEAAVVADDALRRFPDDRSVINNAAYVLAMSGRAPEAIRVIEEFSERDFVLTATLGLAHLANGDIDAGTRLYREAADQAEKVDPDWRSLMTAYQAMVVRQLKLDGDAHRELQALLLAPVELPKDWRDRPEFIRLQRLFVEHGYPWPPTPDLT